VSYVVTTRNHKNMFGIGQEGLLRAPESPWEEREERGIEGGWELASGMYPQDLWHLSASNCNKFSNYDSTI